MWFFTALVALLSLQSCADTRQGTLIETYTEALDSTGFFALVEEPSGAVPPGQVEGQPADFLPYPGNWSRLYALAGEEVSGDSQTDVIILGKPLGKGSVIAIEPIAVVNLQNDNGPWPVVVAVPRSDALRTLRAENFADLLTDYEPVRTIIQMWLLNSKGPGSFQLLGWQDEMHAARFLRQHVK